MSQEDQYYASYPSHYRDLFAFAPYEIHVWKLVRNQEGEIICWRLIEANPKALKSWQQSLKDIRGKTADEIFHGSATEVFMGIVQKIFKERKPYAWDEYFSGTDQTLRMVSIPFDEYFISTGFDISEIRRAEKALRHSATIDDLTQLTKRQPFQERLQQAIYAAKRTDQTVAILFVDIDHFKIINDTLGHDVGDQVLLTVAKSLTGAVRETDTVARLGGDEFLILIHGSSDFTIPALIASKIISEFQSPLDVGGILVSIALSIGIALSNGEHNITPSQLIKNADLAMYRAKEKGRNNYQFFTDDMAVELQRKIWIEKELSSALEQKYLSLYYQPQVNASSESIEGFEALLRWQHPSEGMIVPDEFIPIAEKNGDIIPLGKFVINQACKDINYFIEQGILPKDGRIAINISERQLKDPSLFDFVQFCLNRYKVNPANLEIEITESVLMLDFDERSALIEKFDALGIITAIDDFGSGYSSLNYIRKLPIKVLKIDKSFISDITESHSNTEIVSAIIVMAHKLGLTVVAEGVEKQHQVSFLRQSKCDLIQGDFYGKPKPLCEQKKAQPSIG